MLKLKISVKRAEKKKESNIKTHVNPYNLFILLIFFKRLEKERRKA